MVAMVNKDLLPARLNVPLLGEKVFFSHGLKWNLEFLFFKGPWAPFNQWHLRDEYKQGRKKQELAEQLQGKIALVAAVNLLLMPFVFVLQLIYSFFNYAELIKRDPSSLGVRRWSQYGRLYLRHFNELDHELKARLSRAYKPATRYMELFLSPLGGVIAQNVSFVAASVFAALMVLAIWDEDVLNVDHLLLIMTLMGAVAAASRVFVPDENVVFCPEKTLTAVVAQIHYFPDKQWKGKAHTTAVMFELGELFPYTSTYLLQELLSPILTPFVLYFSLRPRAAAVVEFLKNFTVEVQGVGDICSFAEMDVRRHGNNEWHPPPAATANPGEEPKSVARTNHYTRAEDGKTEMSLVNFSLANPGWKPPQESGDFMLALRDQASRDAEALATVAEEAVAGNALYSSLNSAVGVGSAIAGPNSLYINMAGDLLNEASANARIRSTLEESQQHHEEASSLPPLPTIASPPAKLPASIPGTAATSAAAGSLYQSVQSGLNVANGASTHFRGSLLASSNHPGAGTGYPGSSLYASRLVSTLAPPPNLRQDLNRLGLEYTAADMSLSALYLHELHQRSVVAAPAQGRRTGGAHNLSEVSRYEFEQPRRSSLNELDEENLPLLEGGQVLSSSPRLAASSTLH